MTNVNNNYTDMKNLTPFKLCVLQSFPFIEADFDAVTNYQLLCKVVEYLNKVIDNNNKQNDNISQLEQNFITLYNYVKNYFDNLDVQDEVNKKLDEMVSSGELADLFNKYMIRTYDTMRDLISDGSISINSIAITKGYYTINDKGKSIYLITNNEKSTSIQLNNTLYAECISNFKIPEMFGAYGNGVDDDYIILQNMINENIDFTLEESSIYLISNTLKNVRYLKGKNISSTILCKNKDLDIISTISTVHDGYIKNLTIKHNELGNGNGILLNGNNSQFVISDIFITTVKNGIYGNKENGYFNLYSSVIKNIRIYDFSETGITMKMSGGSGNVYENIYILGGRENTPNYGIYITTDVNSSFNLINVEHSNYIYTYIWLDQCWGASVSSLHFENDIAQPSRSYIRLTGRTSVNIDTIACISTAKNSNLYLFDIISGIVYVKNICCSTNGTGNLYILETKENHTPDSISKICIDEILNFNYTITINEKGNNKRRPTIMKCKTLYCEEIGKDSFLNYNDKLRPDGKYGDCNHLNNIITDNGKKYKNALCIGSGSSTSELLTTDCIIEQYKGNIKWSKSLGTFNISKNMALEVNEQKIITKSDVYTEGDYYVVNTSNITSPTSSNATLSTTSAIWIYYSEIISNY